MNREHLQDIPQPEKTGCLALLVRLTWMAVGNAIVFFTAVFIVQKRAGILLDILFWATVVGLMLTRYLDIVAFHGRTAENEPATLQHWRTYSLLLLVISAVVWIVAHGAARVL